MTFISIFGTQATLFATGVAIAGFIADIKWNVLAQAIGIL